MNSKTLKPKWEALESRPRESAYDVIRISPECLADVYLAISPTSQRCLILALPVGYQLDFRPVERDRLSLTQVNDRHIAVTLIDRTHFDLFDDLIASMHNVLKGIAHVDDYSRTFIKIFYRWAHFFDKTDSDRLPDTIIQGLFGELIVLQRLLEQSPADQVNVVLEAWRGPYDQGHDFVFDWGNIEVKTRTPDNSSVQIANEDQLDQLEGKALELAVVTLERGADPSQTISELAQTIARLVEDYLGDLIILYSALEQKNLRMTRLAEYDDIRFRAHNMARFDCLKETFPRMVRSKLPEAIFGVRYSINTDHLADCIIEQVLL
jgi:hypothetical protein